MLIEWSMVTNNFHKNRWHAGNNFAEFDEQNYGDDHRKKFSTNI